MSEAPLHNVNKSKRHIVLASNSPRRSELLKGLGVEFTVRTLPIDESFPADLEGTQVAGYLAAKKAAAYASDIREGEIFITADTVVVANGSILNKPENAEEAHEMLNALSGKKHEVITAVAIFDQQRKSVIEDRTIVCFRDLRKEEIEYYVKQFKPFDKAGAYGIQEWIGYIAVEKIEGSYYTVMGLPVHLVYQTLREW
ncbi:MAG: septum formation protein Maf [Lunatimonas sp.]|uniref:Maf family nucleotide pyrophosphatase n=1 Tax=Lunatimonas sp. TaxID=2060141 RepID=UPI00263AB9E9|nr:Maf family nucleotide pyrophosphatase [Lunatimonas sp.]MCC5937484.1 septum formation protein Maf [Lunatimonas sp.]